MKFFRSTIILAAVAVIAGFSYWYFIVNKGEKKKEAEQKAAYLFENTDRAINRIVLREKGKPAIEIVRESAPAEASGDEQVKDADKKDAGADAWKILSPVNTGGDATAITGLLNSLKESKKEEVVWENLDKKNEYGLSDPEFSVGFAYAGEQASGDQLPHGIDFGIKNLSGDKVFAAVRGKNMIYSVPASLMNSLDKSLFDLRDKIICPYSWEQIDEITYLSPTGAFKIVREGENWYFLPDKIKASATRLEIFAGGLHWGTFTEVVKEKAEVRDLKQYGFGAPRMIMNFKLKDGSNFLFMVGDYRTENKARFYYATRSTDNMLFQVNEDLLSRLVKTEFDLKDRSIFTSLKQNDVSSVKLKSGDTEYSFLKKEDEWVFADSGEPIQRGYRIDNIVRSIVTAEYEEREPVKQGDKDYAETGIQNPRYVVTLALKEGGSPVVVELTEKNEETGKVWLTPDGGKTAYYTSGYFLSNWPGSREELLE